MTRTLLLLALIAMPTVAIGASVGTGASAAEPSADPQPVLHCQVPCGIYGDRMRIDMLMEDAATIEKGMKQIVELEAAGGPANQVVRWVMAKDDHAQSIQDTVAAYWLAQRIKAPKDGAGEEAQAKYHRQLALLHGITVAAMKCKQTTDLAHVENLRKLTHEFAGTYFSKEDLEHLKDHHK